MAITDMLKKTINSGPTLAKGQASAQVPPGQFRANPSIGGDSVNPAARVGSSPTVLARLRAVPKWNKAIGAAEIGLGAYEHFANGETGDGIMDAATGAGTILGSALPIPGAATAAPYVAGVGRAGAELLAQTILKNNEVSQRGDILTPAAREFANSLPRDAKGNILPPSGKAFTDALDASVPRPAGENQSSTGSQGGTQATGETAMDAELRTGMLTGSPEELAIKIKMAKGEITKESGMSLLADLLRGGAQQAQPAAEGGGDPLAGIRDTISQAKGELSKVKTPQELLQQQTDFKVQDYSNNPLAALGQLNSAVSLLAPGAAANKQARANAEDLLQQADAEAGIAKLADTLKASGIAQGRAQLELDQANALQQEISKLSALDDKSDPDGKKREAQRSTVLAMLGKEPKDGFELKEFGGGTDPVTGLPLPKRLAVFNPRKGTVEYLDGGDSAAQEKPKFEPGKVYQVAGGKVVKFVGYDNKGEPQFDDEV